MTIKELERLTGLPRTSIRFYEQEGFLHPERRENNYRNYSPEDVRTLEKIRLLRQLSLDLDTIRRLQAGELPLSQALIHQAKALEGDRCDLEWYIQVCRQLSRAGDTFDTLDPEPWLKALETNSLPLSRRVDPAQADSIAAAPFPWRRFFARGLDLVLAGVVWNALKYLAFQWYGPGDGAYRGWDILVTIWGAWLILILAEPVLLSAWGYTPGKWFLGLQVRREDGRKLSWEAAMKRLLHLFLWGVGLAVPFVCLICYADSYERCRNDQVLPWDSGLSYTARRVGKRRVALFTLIWLLAIPQNLLILDASWRLPNPAGPLTPEQVVQNYNFLERRVESVWGERPELSLESDGRWQTAPPAYQDTWVWLELENSEWGPVEFTVREDGCVTGFTLVWSPRGNPYGEDLDLLWPATEFLPNLFLSLSPGAEPWPFPWEYTLRERRTEAVGLALSLCQVDFSHTGSHLSRQWQGLGGLTGEVEVLFSQGYRSTYEAGRLFQEDPGAGELLLRYTITLPN